MTSHEQTALPEGGKARRIYLLLRDEISNGGFPEGTLMPGESRLAVQLDVSRVTIRRALEALAQDGWVEKRKGAGSLQHLSTKSSGARRCLDALRHGVSRSPR